MAVTLNIAELKQTTGELSEFLFPGYDLNDLIMGWLEHAVTKVETNSNIVSTNHNAAAAAWIYYRAYSHVAQRLAALPASRRLGPADETTAQDQRAYFAGLAAQKLTEYNGYDSTVIPIGALFTVAPAKRVTC